MRFVKVFIFIVFPVIVGLFANAINDISSTYLMYDFSKFNSYGEWISICFTSGSIVFAIQSFLIPFMRQSLYNTKAYIMYLKSEYSRNWKKEQYRPLKNLSEFLFVTTLSVFLFVIFVTVYIFIRHVELLLISFYFGFISFIGLVLVLFAMRKNFNIMFTYNEENS